MTATSPSSARRAVVVARGSSGMRALGVDVMGTVSGRESCRPHHNDSAELASRNAADVYCRRPKRLYVRLCFWTLCIPPLGSYEITTEIPRAHNSYNEPSRSLQLLIVIGRPKSPDPIIYGECG